MKLKTFLSAIRTMFGGASAEYQKARAMKDTQTRVRPRPTPTKGAFGGCTVAARKAKQEAKNK